MFASYYFDDMFSTLSHLFEHPEMLQLGWNSADYGFYTSGYSTLCIFGGLIVCGMLLDKWGVRVTGSIFVGMMAGGAALVAWAITSGMAPKASLTVAYVGCMLFGLGSEIAGVAVTRSIAKWFKGRNIALAMGLQLAIARLGTLFAFVMSPRLVAAKVSGEIYTLAETARPAFLGLFLISSIIAFKKFATAILIPRFDVPVDAAKWMVSVLPFSTVVFAPLFGMLVDKAGKGTRWMILGAILAFAAHLLLAFAPKGVPFYGYLSMIFLGFGYSLVPAAMWPSVPKIVPDKVLGTAYSLVYWVQNLGLMSFKMFAGNILAGEAQGSEAAGAVKVEIMFICVCIASLVLAYALKVSSVRHPELKLDAPSSE